ncbi:PREDICTED: uncharacterized protein LOC105562456 isoform X2 [Vollenhovia emeryi]|uniref:uncharacterized protein LOC105562456 isoform X2 n=1 Tax=Vollenhovia emeryi TaxID=411798 RepID=UPI0005F4EF4B|nr:PREDICTED: uncharacterized protein LOC105562456 isoform X2 [Vollenhovia emeryi]
MEGTPGKRARISQEEDPGVSRSDDVMQSDENTLSLCPSLNQESLRSIFQYLNGRELGNVAMMCSSWLEAAYNEINTRGPHFAKARIDSVKILTEIYEMRIKPSVGFCFFCTYDFSVINTEPENPNVTVKLFSLINYCNIKITVDYQNIISTIGNCKTSVSSQGTENKTSTCFMLFCKHNGLLTAKRWASVMQESTEAEIDSVWGGVFDKVLYNTNMTVDAGCVAVVITGSVQTWSTILEKECNTEEQIWARLMLFKDKVKLKKHSVGFVYRSRIREKRLLHESYLIVRICERLFPKVPIVGCTGIGEFGKTTGDEVNEEKNGKEDHKCTISWYNEHSIVILILTYS